MTPPGAGCRWFDASWYQDLYRDAEPWLRELDADQRGLVELVEGERDQRLGRYFELLWLHWFRHSERFEVLAENLQVRQQGRTHGELDLVVRDLRSGRSIHVELAVKFYLGEGDTRQACNWLGPNRKDRLDIKMRQLIERQSQLSRQPYVKQLLAELGLQVDDCAVILKGRLFYPGIGDEHRSMPEHSHPDHEKAFWITAAELERLDELDYVPQLRRGWLAGSRPQAGARRYSRAAIRRALTAGELTLPLYLTGYRKAEENLRLFVVDDGWSTTL